MMRILVFLFSLTIIGAASCVTSLDDAVQINPEVREDDGYLETLRSFTREVKVFSDFETKFTMSATVLTADFLAAFANRYQNLYEVRQPILDEATNKAGFFVSFYGDEESGEDLSDEAIWTLLMRHAGSDAKPILVKKLHKKERWRPFFTGVTPWSQEYLVIFDQPLPSLGETGLQKQETLVLTLANSDAKVSLKW